MKNKKLITIASLTIATTLLLTACGGDKKSKKAEGESSDTISMMVPFIENDPPEADNDVLKKIEEHTGKKIKVTWVPNTSYEDKMNITLASDDIPQVMVIQGKTGGFVKSAESGAFWDLTDYLKDYPNLAEADENVLKNSSVNGHIYGIYRRRDVMRSAVILRKDWLEKLNLEEPKTVDDLYTIAKAFTEKDPDGNGQDDTTGLIIPQWPGPINSNSPYDALATWYGAGNAWKETNGELEPSFLSDEYLESMVFVKKMASEGLINKDFATLAADKWNDPFINGKGGIIIDTYSRSGQILNKLKESDPENFANYVTFTGNLAGKDGEIHALPTDGYSGFLSIPKSSVKTEEELKDVLTFLDKTNDKEVQVLINNGIEGVNFDVVDGFSVLKEPQTAEAKVVTNATKSYAQMGTNVGESKSYLAKPSTDAELANFEKQQSLMKSDAEKAVFNPASSFITKTYTNKGAQLDQMITDARLKFIAGQIDEAGWKDSIELWKKSGGTELIKETNELYKNDK